MEGLPRCKNGPASTWKGRRGPVPRIPIPTPPEASHPAVQAPVSVSGTCGIPDGVDTISGRLVFRKILVANRGEIAVRVIRTCREMGIPVAAVYSEPDRGSRHVQLSDEAYALGPASPTESYLNIDRVLDAAARAGADAVHPGYGFLSENADFADACARAGVKLIGPPAAAIRAMGVKTRAREIMAAANVPVVPGSPAAVRDAASAASIARETGYPIMLKAAAGGGGKGMRLVERPEELPSAWAEARGEARQSFGNDDVYVEKAIVQPRHVEVQVLADEAGTITHLGERECSLQRRHQKVLEETPSPFVEARPQVRAALCEAAVAAARAAGYANAGTVEFLVDSSGRFYFLEMNTRLQVEHPVTELVTGIDLVSEQIRIAAGYPLRYPPGAVTFRGHAMQCRIYAEDPKTDFLPSPGRITRLAWPEGPGIRIDSCAEQGWTVPIEYDPLIAKLCAWAPTRDEAIAKLRQALRETVVGGIATTLGFFRELLEDSRFQAGEIDTGFLGRGLDPDAINTAAPSAEEQLAAMLAAVEASRGLGDQREGRASVPSRWKTRGRTGSPDMDGGFR